MWRRRTEILRRATVILLISLAGVAFANGSNDIPAGLCHMDANLFNNYVSAMIKAREPEMKAVLLKEANITDFKLRDAAFDIMTGNLRIQFVVYYKNIDIQGTLNFEIRITDEGEESPKIGGYCLGLEGNLHSSRILADIFLILAKKAVNKHLVGRQFWSDSQPHEGYKVFKNDNLTYIVNQAFINNAAGYREFGKISAVIPDAGTVQVNFKNIKCNQLDLNIGQAYIGLDIAAVLKPDLGFNIKIDNLGSATAGFDLYINQNDLGWWVKLNEFKLTITGLPGVNGMLRDLIDKELNNRRVLIRIDMPQPSEK